MTPRQRVAALVGVFVAGSLLGQCGDHTAPAKPQVKVIVKPSPSPSPVYITKTVQHRQLPESCLRAADTLAQLEALSQVITKGSGQHLENMSHAVEEMYTRNQAKLNEIIQQEIHIKDRVDSAATSYAALHQSLRDQLSRCKTDSAGSS